jgi:hypothetical protein
MTATQDNIIAELRVPTRNYGGSATRRWRNAKTNTTSGTLQAACFGGYLFSASWGGNAPGTLHQVAFGLREENPCASVSDSPSLAKKIRGS